MELGFNLKHLIENLFHVICDRHLSVRCKPEGQVGTAWGWGGGHNDGGTIHREIPEEWFELPYEEFLERTVTLAAAAHYGFTAEMLLEKKGLREFFGYGNDSDLV